MASGTGSGRAKWIAARDIGRASGLEIGGSGWIV
jgi:hypothetical protein